MTAEEVSRVVVVGASLAGLRAVEAARLAGYRGELVLIGDEAHLPYDRPPLSKAFLQDDTVPVSPPPLLGTDQLQGAWDVDVRLGVRAESLDPEARVLDTSAGRVDYDRLVVTTGVRARRLPGEELAGVHTLRTLEDARAVRAALDSGVPTVVVGAGFIGSEVASAAARRGAPVTVVEAAATPLVRAVGERAGRALASVHARHGTDLRVGVGVDGLEGSGGHVSGVRLTDGSVLPAECVVVGIGGTPTTDWLVGSGLDLADGVVCDATLQSSAPGVYAAGDVARWYNPLFDRHMRVEHWTSAVDQGAAAMTNALAGEPSPFSDVPYFWSDWYDSKIQFVGLPEGEPTVVFGSWEQESWTALYRHEARVVGALVLDRAPDVMKYRGLIARRTPWEEALAFADARRAAAAARLTARPV